MARGRAAARCLQAGTRVLRSAIAPPAPPPPSYQQEGLAGDLSMPSPPDRYLHLTTVATPVLTRPIELGADIVMHWPQNI
jgi:hypothetical protein